MCQLIFPVGNFKFDISKMIRSCLYIRPSRKLNFFIHFCIRNIYIRVSRCGSRSHDLSKQGNERIKQKNPEEKSFLNSLEKDR